MAEDTPWYTPVDNFSGGGRRNLMEPRENEYPSSTSEREESTHSVSQFMIPSASNLFTPGLDSQLVGHLAEKGGAALTEQMGRYTTSYFDSQKPYFDVDQKYVLKKILRLIYPFGKWTEGRPQAQNHFGSDFVPNASNASPEQQRMNRPDLYIPVMGFVTFCLMAIATNHAQTAIEGNKKTIGEIFTRQIFWLVLTALAETVILKGGLYFLNAPSNISFMKCVSTSSYKYVGLVILLMLSWLIHSVSSFGSLAYIIIGSYLSVAMAVFIVRSVKEVFVDEKERVRFDQGRSLRTQFLIVFSLIQVPLMFFLSYSFKRGIYF